MTMGAVKGGDEMLIVDPVAPKGDGKGLKGNEGVLKGYEEALKVNEETLKDNEEALRGKDEALVCDGTRQKVVGGIKGLWNSVRR